MEGGLALCLHAQEPLMAIQDAFSIPAASVRDVLVRIVLTYYPSQKLLSSE